MTERRARMRMIRPDQGAIADGEERRARDVAEEADARFLEAMMQAGYRASAPIVDNSPLAPARFYPDVPLGGSSGSI